MSRYRFFPYLLISPSPHLRTAGKLKRKNIGSMKKLLFVSSLVFFIAGFEAKSEPTYINADQPLEVTQLTKQSTSTSVNASLELLDPGIEPRQEMRFTPAVNSQQTLTMTMDVDVSMSIGGQSPPTVDTPAIEMKMETQVTQVDANGDIYADFSYSEVDVIADSKTPPELVNAMQSKLQSLVGLEGSLVMDAQGNTKDVNFDLPEGLDPNTKQMFQQISGSLKQLSSPFPSAAIGIGAQWQVAHSLNLNGMTINQTAIYELVGLQDDVATLAVNIKQDAPSQTINQPGMPPGASVKLESLDSEGQANIEIELDQIMPIIGNISLKSQTQMKITGPNGGREMNMDMNLSMDMDLESE
ncbi:MAG: hypothetical protein F6K21_39315 [Symploca sp. SIO2D2]|nr:hypothetical protein [Symploca sp. SIO2D2]